MRQCPAAVAAACLALVHGAIVRYMGMLRMSHAAGFLRVERMCRQGHRRHGNEEAALTVVLVSGGPGQVGTKVWRPDAAAVEALLRPGDCVVAYDHRGTAIPTALFGHTSNAWLATGALSPSDAETVRTTMLTDGLARDLNSLGRRIRKHGVHAGHRLVAWGMSYGALVAHVASLDRRCPFETVVLDSPSVAGRERYARDSDAHFWDTCSLSPRCSSAAESLPLVLAAERGNGNECVAAIQPHGAMRILREVAKCAPKHFAAVIDALRDCPSGPEALVDMLVEIDLASMATPRARRIADGTAGNDSRALSAIRAPVEDRNADVSREESESLENGSVHQFAHAAVMCADLLRMGTAETMEMARACAVDQPEMALIDGCAALQHYSATTCAPIVAAGIVRQQSSPLPGDRHRVISHVPHVLLTGGLDAVTGAAPARRFYGARTADMLIMHVVRAQHVLFPDAPCMPAVVEGLRTGDWDAAIACVERNNAKPIRWV